VTQTKVSTPPKIQRLLNNQAVSSSTKNLVTSPASSGYPSLSMVVDPQTQMTLMLTESFSKLTTVLSDKSTGVKSE
jgi:hypothetical protein